MPWPALHAWIACALLAALTACGVSSPDLYADRRPLGGPRVVRFDASAGVPIVEVEINGAGPFRFVFDTGAAMLAIDESVAQQLALPRSRYADPGFARSVGGHIDVYFRRVERLQVGTLELTGIDAMVSRISENLAGAVSVDGLLGLGAFHPWVTTIDYETQTIHFADGPPLSKSDPDVLPIATQYGLALFVEGRMAGKRRTVRLDTGAAVALAGTERFVRSLEAPPSFRPFGTARSPSGSADLLYGRLGRDLELGRHRFPTPILALVRGHYAYLSSGRDYGALLEPPLTMGTAWLRNFRTTVDQRSGRVRLERRNGVGPIESPPIRIVLIRAPVKRDAQHLVVVDPSREAAIASLDGTWDPALQPGDRILSVGGVPAAMLTTDSFRDRRDGAEVPLRVQRGERIFEHPAPVVTLVR